MRSQLSRWGSCAVLGSALMLHPDDASAQTAVLFSPPDSSEIRELRVAMASSGPTAVWFSVKMFGGCDDVFVVVPAPPGAAVDTSTDAWFEALSASTNTRVLPPSTPPACGSKPGPGIYETIGADAHEVTLAPVAAAETLSFAELVIWAKAHGLLLSAEQTARLANLEVQGNRFVALRFSPPAGESISRTLRVSPASPQSSTPLLLSPAGSTKVPATVWHLAPGRAWPKTLATLPLDPAKLRWNASAPQAHSNYPAVWDSVLAAADGHGWIIDSASHDIFFQSMPIASGTASVPSVGATYFERAAAYGDASADWSACTSRFASLQQSSVRLATACGRGQIAWVGGAQGGSCKEDAQPGELHPDEVRCGPLADDFAMAFSGSKPSEMWLTRWTGWIPAWVTRTSEAFEIKPGPAVLPVLTCSAYDKDCDADAGADGGSSPGDPQRSDAGQGGSAGSSGTYPGGGGSYGGASGSPSDPGSDDDCEDCGGDLPIDPNLVVEASCSGDSSSSSSGDSCSGDSSDSGGDSCDGDSSGGGDSCDGDSSGGGDSCDGDSSGGGESCDGDTSGGGESCDGGGSTGSTGSCSGSSAGGSDCSIAKGRGRRAPPLSGITLGLVALLLPLRRWRKG
jgi:hypothetical protein